MPCRKQAFNRMTKKLNLTEAYIPFDTNHIYHAWIENVAGNIISKTCIYNHKQSTGLANALDKELLTVLNNKNIVEEYYKLHPLSHKYSLPEDELKQLSNIFSTHTIYSLCEIICNKKYKI